MRLARTTICCRCFARIASASLLVATFTWFASASSQGLPDTSQWSEQSVDPPAGAPIAPILAGSTIIVPLQGGAIAGHSLADGRRVWKVEQAIDKPLASDAARVFIASAEAIVARDAGTGSLQWQLGLGGPATATPLAHGGWVIAAAAGELIAIRAADGQAIWRLPVGPVEFRPAVDGDLLVVSIVDGDVLGLDLQTGTARWNADLGASPSEPFAIGGRVFVGSRDKRFFALNASSGRIEWPLFVGALIMGRAAADQDHVYFAALDNVLWTLNRGHGAIEWKHGLSYRPAAGPVLIGENVFVPGPVESMPSFNAKTGTPGRSIVFPARLAALPLLGHSDTGTPFVVGITGGLENKWTLSLFVPSPVPQIPVLPLTELPGEVMPLPGR